MVCKIDKTLLKLTLASIKKTLSKIDDNLKEFETYINNRGEIKASNIISYLEKNRLLDNTIVKYLVSLRESGVEEGYVNLISTHFYVDRSLSCDTSDGTVFYNTVIKMINDLVERNLDITEVLKVIGRKYNSRKDV